MPRRPPRVLVVASAVLLAAVVGLWVRSYWRADYAWNGTAAREAGLISACGHVLLYREAAIGTFRFRDPGGYGRASRSAPARLAEFAPRNTRSYVNIVGFGAFAGDDGRTAQRCWFFPYWAVAVTLAVPLVWLARRRIQHGRERGHCPSCGYDLTANASGRCPECGADVPPAAAAEPRA
jgi:hypothetical protein